MAAINVEIDGLMCPVDADEWAADPEDVTERVRHNRVAVSMATENFSDEADTILGNT